MKNKSGGRVGTYTRQEENKQQDDTNIGGRGGNIKDTLVICRAKLAEANEKQMMKESKRTGGAIGRAPNILHHVYL